MGLLAVEVLRMSRFRNHKYSWDKPFGSVHHDWRMIGPMGGVNLHVSCTPDYGDTAGLDFHRTALCGLWKDSAPSHVNCPVTGGQCWHDGTSLYAMETVWPMAKQWLQISDHEAIFRMLEREYDDHFARFDSRLTQIDE